MMAVINIRPLSKFKLSTWWDFVMGKIKTANINVYFILNGFFFFCSGSLNKIYNFGHVELDLLDFILYCSLPQSGGLKMY